VELPAQLYPARNRLAATLAEYERALAELEGYKAKAERAAIAEDRAMDDPGLSEGEAAAAIQTAILEKSVLKSRIANREAARARLLADLKASVMAGHREFSRLVNEVRVKRVEVLSKRVMEAGQLTELHRQAAMDELLESAGPIAELRRMEISHEAILYTIESPEQVQTMASRILAGYEVIAVKAVQEV